MFGFGASSNSNTTDPTVVKKLKEHIGQLQKENHDLKESQREKPLFRFGVIADIQYADIEDANNFSNTELRKYRSSLGTTREAVASWNQWSDPPIQFVAQLGDLIDGQNAGKYGQLLGQNKSDEALESIMNELEGADKHVMYHHCVGNHELYNFNWSELEKKLNVEGRHKCSTDGRFYYSFRPALGWTFIVLNPYEISLIQDEGSAGYKLADEILKEHNPNDIHSQGAVNYFEGLVGAQKRIVPFNGGVSEEQLEWLREEVLATKQREDKVVVLSHIPLHERSASWLTVAFNYEEIMNVLKLGNLVAVLAGHRHRGGYFKEQKIPSGGSFVRSLEYPIHHITFQSPLSFEDTFGMIEVFNDRMEIKGCAGLGVQVLPFT